MRWAASEENAGIACYRKLTLPDAQEYQFGYDCDIIGTQMNSLAQVVPLITARDFKRLENNGKLQSAMLIYSSSIVMCVLGVITVVATSPLLLRKHVDQKCAVKLAVAVRRGIV
jgi:hypothetical protein